MKLVEFLAPLGRSSYRDKCLAVLYFAERYEDQRALTAEEVRQALGRARVPTARKINVPDVLAKSGHYVDSAGKSAQGRRLWSLTDSGRKHVRDLLGLPEAEPEIEHDVGALITLLPKIADAEARGYVEEAINCLQVGALRAAVVFLWTGAIRTLQERGLGRGVQQLNAAIQKHDPKARRVMTIDHFAYIKDSVCLDALRELGVLDKGEKATLGEALDLRNRCGHPTKYRPGVKKASSFIEDVLGIVFA